MRRIHRVGFRRSYLRLTFWRSNVLLVAAGAVLLALTAGLLLLVNRG